MAPESAGNAPRFDARADTVRRQFDARAARFYAHDALAREVARRLLERLDLVRLPVTHLVDLGCGAGRDRGALLERFAGARWTGIDLSEGMLRAGRSRARRWLRPSTWFAAADARVCATAERLPLADASVDLVYSNLMLHWHRAPDAVLCEIGRVLRPGGLVVFSSYGPDTWAGLRRACAHRLPACAPMPLVDMHDLGDMLVAAGFEAPVMEVERLDLSYPDPGALLREARALGGNPRIDRPAGLPSGSRARALRQDLAAAAGPDGRTALQFEIVYGHGWRGARRPDGTAVIAPPRSRRG